MTEKYERLDKIDAILKENIEPEVLDLLRKAVEDEGLRNLMYDKEDEPHREAHVIDVTRIFLTLAEDDISLEETYLGLIAIYWHDIGYKLVEKGLLTYEKHHLGSAFLASQVVDDPRIIEAILLHVEDALPEDTPLWIRLIRDADRISALGFTGLNRFAKYAGYTDNELDEDSQKKGINDGIYVGRYKEKFKRDYSQKDAFIYFQRNVLPYLIRTKNILYLDIHANLSHTRIVGGYDYDDNAVEPIVKKAFEYFGDRISITNRISTDIFTDDLHSLDRDYTVKDIKHIIFEIKCIGLDLFKISFESEIYRELESLLDSFR